MPANELTPDRAPQKSIPPIPPPGGIAGLCFLRQLGNHASGKTFLRGCYDQILGPRGHFAKFANGPRRHSDAWVHLDPHLFWQATKGYVERGNAFRLISHMGSLTIWYLTADWREQPYNLSTPPATGRKPAVQPCRFRLQRPGDVAREITDEAEVIPRPAHE